MTRPHRNTTYIQLAEDLADYAINDIEVVIIQLTDDEKWWIVPDDQADEEHFTDIGPYDTQEEASVFMRLLGSKT